MNYGPELVAALVPELRDYRGRALRRVEAGNDWCLLAFKGGEPLFFTWNPESFGVCALRESDLRDLRCRSVKTPFSLGLQRRLVGGALTDASCAPGDRVLFLKFRRFVGGGVGRDFTLILELTGRMSNSLFTDENGVILEAARHIRPDVNRYRSVLPGLPYTPPPPFEGELASPDMDDARLGEFLARPRGLGRAVSRALAGLWADGEREFVRRALFGRPKYFQRLGNTLTALGAALPQSVGAQTSGLDFCRASIAGEIRRRDARALASRALKILGRQRGRRTRHMEGLLSQIENAERADEYRAAGEALVQNIGKPLPRGERVTLTYWTPEGEKSADVIVNPALDTRGNALAYFKKYRKYRADVAAVRERVRSLQAELDDIAALEANVGRLESAERLSAVCEQIAEQYGEGAGKKNAPPRAAKTPPPHLRFQLGGSLILVGLNERGNRYVTFREASPDDLWFHVHEFPGSHVILKNPPAGGAEREIAVRAAASLALRYSACAGRESVIDFTEKKQVRHIAGSGPANVTYKRPKTILVGADDWRSILE